MMQEKTREPGLRLQLKDKRVTVVGLGRSGISVARYCQAQGGYVTATDNRPLESLPGVADLRGRASSPRTHEIVFELGGHRLESFTTADLIVLSPGVPDIEPLRRARRASVPVLGELELSSRFVSAPVIAVTGTNGKSTTTSLLGEVMARTGRPTFVGGNLGIPLVEALGGPAVAPGGALVLELSSFQLETVSTFHAHVALLLNLSEDHLDRYPDYASYIAAKARIFERQTGEDFAVVNGMPGQERCVRLAAAGEGRVLTFGLRPPAGDDVEGAWLDGDHLVLRLPGEPAHRLPRDLLHLPGLHNVQNALAALLGARLAGASPQDCEAGLRAFSGLPHRMELVAQRGGVRFYNDSKATNVGSVVGSLSGFETPLVLIAGGKDKGGDYAPLIPVLKKVARHLVLIGAAAQVMERALGGAGVPMHNAADLPAAVGLAAELAAPGEAVVLSPACSSFDMFDNYEQRGQVFAEAAQKLAEHI